MRHPLPAARPLKLVGAATLFVATLFAARLPALALAADGAKPPAISVNAHGLYRDIVPPPLGRDPIELVKTTDTIEACPKAIFGYHYLIEGLPVGEIEVRKVVMHPPMKMPNGTIEDHYERILSSKVDKDGWVDGFQGFQFDETYERVAGPWTIETWLNGQKVATRTFTVVPCPEH